MNRPAWAISDSSPAVLSATVLPPVLGPVISRMSNSPPSSKLIGTTSPRSSGWRALTSLRTGWPAGRGKPTSSGAVRALLLGQRGRRAGQVDLRQAFDAARQRVGLLADLLAQRAQDALDLALLFEDQRAPAIAHLDHGQRLDEQRGAAGRLIVDDARHLAARLGADRDDVAAGALGDHRVLDDVAKGRRRT